MKKAIKFFQKLKRNFKPSIDALSKEEESEFGDGYGYCLGLFLAHAENMKEWRRIEKEMATPKILGGGKPYDGYPSMWFNGAADHLFGLTIPRKLPFERREAVADWRDKCLKFRLCMNGEACTWDDVGEALQFAKDALREWDEINGVKTIKGQWE